MTDQVHEQLPNGTSLPGAVKAYDIGIGNARRMPGSSVRHDDAYLNGFKQNARSMIHLGYCPLPVAPGQKFPSEYLGRVQDDREAAFYKADVGEFCGKPLRAWQLYTRERWMSYGPIEELDGLAYDLEAHERAPILGIGILCSDVIGIDIDSDDPQAIEAVRLVLNDACSAGAVYVAKRGKKGMTIFGRNGGLSYLRLTFAGRTDFIEILAGAKMSVLPPSIHPELKQPYVWVSERTLFDTHVDDLPLITKETIREIRKSLDAVGISTVVPAPERKPRAICTSFDLEARVNTAAFADLPSWVPLLHIYGCEPKSNGYNALADWVSSPTGRPDHVRKLNLSITPEGIKDFGDEGGRGYTPIGLVAASQGLSKRQALKWLMRHVDFEPLPPWNPIGGDLPQLDPITTIDEEDHATIESRPLCHVPADLDISFPEARCWLTSKLVAPPPEILPGCFLWSEPGPDDLLSVRQAGALTNMFVQRFRDEIIPAQRECERLLQRISDPDPVTLGQLHRAGGNLARIKNEIVSLNERHSEELLVADQQRRDRVNMSEAVVQESRWRQQGGFIDYYSKEDAEEERGQQCWEQVLEKIGLNVQLLRIKAEFEAIHVQQTELATSYALWIASPYPGTGKTRSVTQELLTSTALVIIVASASNRLSHALHLNSQGEVSYASSLAADGPDGLPLCSRRDEGAVFEAYGGARASLCGTDEKPCPQSIGCAGRRMLDALGDARKVAVTQAHLSIGLPEAVGTAQDPDAIVVDEALTWSVYGAPEEIPIVDLKLDFDFGDRATADRCFRQLRTIIAGSEYGGVQVDSLRTIEIDTLKAARKAISGEINRRREKARDADIDLLQLEAQRLPAKRLRILLKLVESLIDLRYNALAFGRRGDIVKAESGALLFSPKNELDSSLCAGRPILYLNAFPEPEEILLKTFTYHRWLSSCRVVKADDRWVAEIYAKRFELKPNITRMSSMKVRRGRGVRVIQYRANDGKALVTPIGLGFEHTEWAMTPNEIRLFAKENSWSEKGLLQRLREFERRWELAEFIKHEARDNRQVVVVASKRFRQWLKLWFQDAWPRTLHLLEWGRSAGTNQYESFDSIVVVGDKTEPTYSRRLRASAIDGHWLELDSSDPFSDWARVSETMQAMERLRTVHDKDKDVVVHVLNEVDLPIDCEVVEVRKLLQGVLRMDWEQPAEGPGREPPQSDSKESTIESLWGAECIAWSRRGLTAYHGVSDHRARQLLAEDIPKRFNIVSAKLRSLDGIKSNTPAQKFAIAAGANPEGAIGALTRQRVEWVKADIESDIIE